MKNFYYMLWQYAMTVCCCSILFLSGQGVKAQLAAVQCGTPDFGYSCNSYGYNAQITNVTFNGNSHNPTGCYQAAGAIQATFNVNNVPGASYLISTTYSVGQTYGWDTYWQIWIDWNNNGAFDFNELVVEDYLVGANNYITVPSGVTSGPKRMRVLHSFWYWEFYENACTGINGYGPDDFGDFKDYQVNLNPPINDDASVTALGLTTAPPFAAGNNTVVATIRNNANSTKNLTSVVIDWTANGTPQTPVTWTGSVTPGNTTTVNLGTFNFPAVGGISFRASTRLPNGVTDQNITNDSSANVIFGAALNGTFTVGGASPNFTTLAPALTQLSLGGTLGPVTFNVRPGTYTGYHLITTPPGNQSTRPIIIKSDETAGGTSNNVILSFNGGTGAEQLPTGSSGITGGAPTLRVDRANFVSIQNLTIQNTGSPIGYNIAVELTGSNASQPVGSTNVSFDNVVFTSPTSTTLTLGNVTVLSDRAQHTNLTFRNCTVNGGAIGVYVIRASSGASSTGMLIQNSTFTGYGSWACRVSFNDNATITGNTWNNSQTTVTNGVLLDNNNTLTFSKNRINYTNAVSGSGVTFNTSASTATRNLCSNNFVNATGTGVNGIAYTGALNTDIMHNTVYVNSTGSAISATSGSGATIVNNIFYNVGSGFATRANSSVIGSMNFNTLFTAGTSIGSWNSVSYGLAGGADPLLTWKANTITADQQSSFAPITFSNPANGNYDLTAVDSRLYGTGSQSNNTSNAHIRNRVPDDFYGTTRNRPEVYVGAHQIVPVITVSQQPPLNFEGCQNQNMVLGLIANGSFGSVLSYQWQRNGAPLIDGVNGVTGSRTATLTVVNAQPSLHGGEYVCIITGTGGATPVTTPTINVVINAPIEIVRHPEPKILCVGNETSLSVVANGTILGYQWQRDGININGATSPIYVMSNVDGQVSGRYRCVLSGTCGTNIMPTREAVIYVAPSSLILRSPETKGVALGTTASLSIDVDAAGQIPVNSPSFQWFRGSTPLRDDARISGTTTSNLTIRNIRQSDIGIDYTCVVNGLCGASTSQSGGFIVSNITLTTQPQNVESCVGADAVMSVSASSNLPGVTYTYQWMKDNRVISNSSNVTGTSSNTLRISNLSLTDLGSYTVMVTSSNGSNITSNPATINVLEKPAVTTQPTNVRICEGASASMSIVATGGGLRYQWQASGVDVPGATGTTVTVPNVPANFNGAKVTCIVTNNCGNVTSSEALLTVDPKPFVVEQPTNRVVNFGGKLTLTVRADNATRYQWTLNGTDIPGATTATYEVRNAVMADEGRYTVKMTNDCGTIESQTAQVQVGPTSVEEESLKAGYAIASVTPLPAGETVTITYTTPESQMVRISINDIQGREVAEVFNAHSVGQTSVVKANVSSLANGTYTIVLQSGRYMVSKQIVIVR
jgi:hypothetical protein